MVPEKGATKVIQTMLSVAPHCIRGYLHVQKALKGGGMLGVGAPLLTPLPKPPITPCS